jgi:pimeloyl-ACP methyl ester carboxylesterase
MKLRSVVGTTLGVLGVTTALNRLLAKRAGPLDPPSTGSTATYRWRGFDVAYAEGGDPDAPDIVLIHGVNAAASGHEFREVFAALSEDYHVVAPDLPGFGRSDRPPLQYSGALYEAFVADFLDDVADQPTVVASSLTGAYVARAAQTVALERLVLVCPTAETMGRRRPWVRSLFRTPVVGQALFNLVASRPAIRYFGRDHAYADPASLTPARVDHQWQTAHQPGARFAPASFVSGYLDVDADLGALLAAVDVPVTLVWGRDADISPLATGERLAADADARLVVFDDAKLLPHSEHPRQFVREVLTATPSAASGFEFGAANGGDEENGQ